MKKRLITSFNLIGLTLLTLSPLSAQMVKQGDVTVPLSTNPNGTFADYKKECLNSVKQNPVLAEFATEMCNCTISEYQKEYSLAEFRTLVRKSQPNPQGIRSPEAETAWKTLMAVGEDCAAEIVFE
ncbi:MAG: hypothetical protein AB4041_01275 [Microcystaceae cyanobacterium]